MQSFSFVSYVYSLFIEKINDLLNDYYHKLISEYIFHFPKYKFKQVLGFITSLLFQKFFIESSN